MWFGCAATAGELVASLSSTGRGVRGAPGAATLGPLQSRPGRAGESRPAVSPQGQAWRASSWKQDQGEAPGGERVSSRPLGSVSPSVIVAKAGAVFSGLTTRRALP